MPLHQIDGIELSDDLEKHMVLWGVFRFAEKDTDLYQDSVATLRG